MTRLLTTAVSANVLNRQFEQALPNQGWVCDITDIRTKSGWLYLAAVLNMERVWHKDYVNHLEAKNDIADCIVGFYNAVRVHSKLGNLSLTAFERESTSEKPIKLSEIT